jgi:hypothetical protein|tara:strand:- start:1283 stop:2269 length:987 start_codon:yes stop_codon:yes gene_type:complete
MKNEIIYRQTNQNEFENCLKLISKFRKNSNLNKKFIEWDYILNPFGKAKIFVAEYKNEFIGIMFCKPLKFQSNKKIYNGYRLQDMLTNTDFLRKEIRAGKKIPRKEGVGIFPNLLKVTNNFLDENSEINIGFPNEKSLPFFENKWVGLSKIPWVLHKIPLILKNLDNKQKFQLKYNLINKFTNTHENIWRENINNKIDIMWTKEYSKWRYTLNPRSNYKAFEIKNNTKIIGYIILKKYEKENELPVGHICQLVCHDDYIKDSIDFAANYFSDLSVKKLTMWRINDKNLFIKNLGFKKIFLEKKKFMYKGKKIFDKSFLNLSMSFSDTY